ncbi:hypothetical protein BVG80_03105 [Sphingobacteriales bacterium TSM_CSM]|nr:hypothetical protein BVG80_03105 [Sphingobacteriales bacterium TSM_CSM]
MVIYHELLPIFKPVSYTKHYNPTPMAEDKSWIAKLTALIGSLALTAVTPDAGLSMILGGVATNISSQFLYDLFNPRWQKLWRGKDGILNHDIQKALVAALQEAYKQIEENYTRLHTPGKSEKESIAYFITVLSAEAAQRLLQPDAQSNPLGAQELLSYLSFTQETQIYPQLQERLQLLSTNPPNEWEANPLSEQFLQYFKGNLGALVKEAFIAQLIANPVAKEKLTLLYFEVLNQSVTQGNEQIMNVLQNLQTQVTHAGTYTELWVSAIRRFNERFEELKQGQDQILKEVKNLPEAVQQAVAAGFKQLSPAAVLPNFMASERYNSLTQQLTQLQNEQRKLIIKIEKTKEVLTNQPEEHIEELLKGNLQDLQIEHIQTATKLADTQKELESFMRDVLALAQTIGSGIDAGDSPRLQAARRLFEAGNFEAANNTLNETAIDEEIHVAQRALANLANELQLKAQIIALNKTRPDWFEEAKRLYEKGVATHSSYHTCFACAYFLGEHKQHRTAIQYYQQMLLFSAADSPQATALNSLGNLEAAMHEYFKALAHYREALKIYRNLAQTSPQVYLPDVAMTLNNLGNIEVAMHEYSEALAHYREALKIYRTNAQTNPQVYLSAVAETLNNLGILQWAMNEYPEALINYQEALQIKRTLAQTNPQAYLRDVAETLNNLGILQWAMNEYPEALINYQEALQIKRTLAQTNPQAYLRDVAETLNNLGILQWAMNEYPEALINYQEALQIFNTLAQVNPQTYLFAVGQTLNNLGILQVDMNQYTQALQYYLKALQIYRNLAQTNLQVYLPYIADNLNNLGNLQADMYEYSEALAHYLEALQIYRTHAQTNPQVYLPYLVNITVNLSTFYKDCMPDKEISLQYAKEALIAAQPVSHVPSVQEYISTLHKILEYWDD